jgi:FAD/FMN-containing dehydrogenase
VEVEKFRELHHALQECINLKTARIHAVDRAVTRLTYPVCAGYAKERCQELAGAGLEALVFGHWDDTLPLGIHIFAQSAEQYQKAKAVMARWHREDLTRGETKAPHRGIGKVYRDVFSAEDLKRRKAAFDPDGLFNPGNGGI